MEKEKRKSLYCLFFLIIFFSLFFFAKSSQAATPSLNFSDLIDGPKSGLGDGLGEGAIVTVWGNNLGSSQGSSKIYIKDSASNSFEAAHVYYWGNADGTSNGTHADLFTRQKMQEISFSIPSALADGAGKIYVTTPDGTSNELDFYVRSTGTIYWVKTTGNDSTGNGSWLNPWQTISRATATSTPMEGGDLVYACDGVTTASTINLGNSGISKSGSDNNRTGLLAYPGTTVTVNSNIRSWCYNSTLNSHWVVSKMNVVTETESGIGGNAYGRIVGNKITGSPPDGGQSGAIGGSYGEGYDRVSAIKVFGNHIHDWGSSSTDRKEHTTYFSIRWDTTVPGIEIAWNYLKDNKPRYGLHYYDEGSVEGGRAPGNFSTPSSMHHNWVENQGGSGINIGTQPDLFSYSIDATGTWYVYDNVLVNCGLTENQGIGSNAQAMAFYGRQNLFDIYAYNNTIYGYGETVDSTSAALWIPGTGAYGEFGGTWTHKNNIIADTKDFPWHYSSNGTIKIPTSATNNLCYNGGDNIPVSLPTWDNDDALSVNPFFTNASLNIFTLQSSSPAKEAGANLSSLFNKDFYGNTRTVPWSIGAFEYVSSEPGDTTAPKNPSGLSVS